MSIVKNLSALALAAAVTVAALPATASAQGLFDSLWGGEAEYGGKRTTVAFPKNVNPGQIVVSFGDRRLYNVVKPGVAVSYPIAVPREKSRWSGVTTVTQKRENPDWTPTPEMFKENPRLPPWVPGGHPMNPLGVRAMYLGGSTYRIHGTDAPWTIGQAVSKGCIRMFNEDVKELYTKIPVGTKVTVTWDRYANKIAALGDVPQIEPTVEKAETSSKPKKATKVARAEISDETKSDEAKSSESKSSESKSDEGKSTESKSTSSKSEDTKSDAPKSASTSEKKSSDEAKSSDDAASDKKASTSEKTSSETKSDDTASNTSKSSDEKSSDEKSSETSGKSDDTQKAQKSASNN